MAEKGRPKKMLITKHAVSEGSGKEFRFFPYDKPNYAYPSDWPTEPLQFKRAKGLDSPEVYFTGTAPKGDAPREQSADQLDAALNDLISRYGTAKTYEKISPENKGFSVALDFLTDAVALKIGNQVKADNAVVDPIAHYMIYKTPGTKNPWKTAKTREAAEKFYAAKLALEAENE